MNTRSLHTFLTLPALFVAILSTSGYGQDKKHIYHIPKGTVGVVRVLGQTPSSTKIKIEFCEESLLPRIKYSELQMLDEFPFTISEASYSIVVDGAVRIFDEQGIVANIKNQLPKIGMPFWCENDGGIQFRPSIVLELPNKELQRPLRALKPYDRVAGFVGVGADSDFPALTKKFVEKKRGYDSEYPEDFHHLVMEGRLSKNGPAVARLTESFSEAGCYNGVAEVESSLDLEFDGSGYGVWCCGP